MISASQKKPFYTSPYLLLVLAAGLFAASWIAYACEFGFHLSGDHEVWAQFGEYMGGLLGPSFSVLTFVFLILAFQAQSRANAIAELTAQRQLRAYVSVSAVLASPLTVGQKPSAEISFKNLGNTPAKNVMLAADVQLYYARTPFDFPLKPHTPASSRSALAQSQTKTVTCKESNVLTAADLQDIKADRKILYVYGRLDYVDIFDNECLTVSFPVNRTLQK